MLYEKIRHWLKEFNKHHYSTIDLAAASAKIIGCQCQILFLRFVISISLSPEHLEGKTIPSADEYANDSPMASYESFLSSQLQNDAAEFIRDMKGEDGTERPFIVMGESQFFLVHSVRTEKRNNDAAFLQEKTEFAVSLYERASYEREKRLYQEYINYPEERKIAEFEKVSFHWWCAFRYAEAYFTDENTIVRKVCVLEDRECKGGHSNLLNLRKLGLANGYDFFPPGKVVLFVDRHIGETYASLEATIVEKAKARMIQREEEKNRLEKRKQKIYSTSETEEDLKPSTVLELGIIIGLTNDIDIRQYDFSVRLLCSSFTTFEQRKTVVKEHKKEIIDYVITELKKKKSAMRKIGDLRYYELTSIRVMRVPEIEFLFSVKGADKFYKNQN